MVPRYAIACAFAGDVRVADHARRQIDFARSFTIVLVWSADT
jgi:hypothetical protein